MGSSQDVKRRRVLIIVRSLRGVVEILAPRVGVATPQVQTGKQAARNSGEVAVQPWSESCRLSKRTVDARHLGQRKILDSGPRELCLQFQSWTERMHPAGAVIPPWNRLRPLQARDAAWLKKVTVDEAVPE